MNIETLRNKTGVFRCAPKRMVALLRIMKHARYGFEYLNKFDPKTDRSEVYTFRDGARLVRKSLNTWQVQGYTSDNSDVVSAWLELEAAKKVLSAIELMNKLQDLNHTPKKFCVYFVGLRGSYPDGQEYNPL